MEPTRNIQDIGPRQPGQRANQPLLQRPMINDMITRPAARPAAPRPVQAASVASTAPLLPGSKPQAQSAAPKQEPLARSVTSPASNPPLAAPIGATPLPAQPQHEIKPHDTQKHRPKRKKVHSALVGWSTFVLLLVVFFAVPLPSFNWQNAPGNNVSFSTGAGAIDCLGPTTNISASQAYQTKRGFPVVYDSQATMTVHGTCQGTRKSVVASQTSQLNPLAILIDAAAALLVAVVVTKIWKRVRAA